MDFVTDLPESCNADSMLVVVDRFSKAIVITLVENPLPGEETAQLYMDHVWRRTGLPRQVISDRGPQFASKVMKETWKQLKVDQAMSTAFHPQTDGETERVNQEIEQFLRIFCNYQATTGQTSFRSPNSLITYALIALPVIHPFRSGTVSNQTSYPPPLSLPKYPLSKITLPALEQLRIEVSAALKLASEVMKRKGPSTPSQQFTTDQLVWLEGTNIKTTHPKAKLAPNVMDPSKSCTHPHQLPSPIAPLLAHTPGLP